MAGEAKTAAFVLSSATVMMGPLDKVFEFQPDTHSIGLVKNFTMSSDMTYTELTQGAKNTVVHSTATNVAVRCNMEVYEYTAKNLAYGLGLDGASLQSYATHTLDTAITGGATAKSATIASDVSTIYKKDDWVTIQGPNGATADIVHLAKLSTNSAFATGNTTLTFDNHPVPTGTSFPIGSKVEKVNMIQVGSKDEQPYLAAKIVGILPEQNKPVTVIIPKLRITKGFSMAFRTDGYGNMPFEFTPYDLVASDPTYPAYGGQGQAFIYTNT